MERSVPSPSTFAVRTRTYLRNRIAIDTRSLAVFRIICGLLIVADVLLRSRNFSFFYTEDGVVPQATAQDVAFDGAVSVYYLTTDPTVIAGLFVLQALIALALVVGYKTRVATVLSFLFVISLDHHNPLVLSYADTLFRLLLFWAIFLPLGERWSVDAVHADRIPRVRVSNAATALILFQMVFMYFVNGLHKSTSWLWTSGQATPLILGIDEITFLLGNSVRTFPTLLQYGGLTWYYLMLFPWLLLLLWGRARMLFLSLYLGGHTTFALTVRIGAFPYVAMAGLSLFVPTTIWNDAGRLLAYVGVTGSKTDAVRATLVRFAESVPDVSLDDERVRRARNVGYYTGLYTVVGTVVLVALIITVNAGILVDDPDADVDERIDMAMANSSTVIHVDTVARSFGVNQPTWSVFAPTPRSSDRYYVFPAKTADGEYVDVYNERDLTYERPGKDLQNQYSTYRERFYMNSVRRGQSDSREQLAEHICETWEEEHGEELLYLNMYTFTEEITIETMDSPEDREIGQSWRFYTHGCGDNDPEIIDGPDW